MKLKPLLKTAVALAFSIPEDLLVEGTLHLGRSLEYDPLTDQSIATYAHTVIIKGFRLRVTDIEGGSEDAEAVKVGMIAEREVFKIQAKDLPPGLNMTPGEVQVDSDFVGIAGEDWNIYKVLSDPASLTFTLLIRKT